MSPFRVIDPPESGLGSANQGSMNLLLNTRKFKDNISDLSEKIIKYSEDNYARKKIAKKGRVKYFKYFNSKIVADFIINKTFGINKKYFW